MKRDWTGRLLLLGAVIALGVAFVALGLERYFTLDMLRTNATRLRAFVDAYPLVAHLGFVVVYAAVVALSLPFAGIMTIAGGLLFGLWMGAALSVLGATAGSVVLLFVARYMLGDMLRRRAGPFLSRLSEGFTRNAFSYLLVLRLVPAFPFWAVNLAAALLGVPVRSFAAATLIGIVPGSLAYATLGDGLGLAAADDRAPLTPGMIAVRVAFLLLAFLPLAARFFNKKKSP